MMTPAAAVDGLPHSFELQRLALLVHRGFAEETTLPLVIGVNQLVRALDLGYQQLANANLLPATEPPLSSRRSRYPELLLPERLTVGQPSPGIDTDGLIVVMERIHHGLERMIAALSRLPIQLGTPAAAALATYKRCHTQSATGVLSIPGEADAAETGHGSYVEQIRTAVAHGKVPEFISTP